MLIVNDPLTDPFDGMADFVIDPESVALRTERQRRTAWQLKATNYEIALKVVEARLRPVQKKPTAKQMAAQIEMAREEIERVLMPELAENGLKAR